MYCCNADCLTLRVYKSRLFLFLQLVKYDPGPPLHRAERQGIIIQPEADSISRVDQTFSGQH